MAADNPVYSKISSLEIEDNQLLTIDSAENLDNWHSLPAYMAPDHGAEHPHSSYASCSFCGVGDSGLVKDSENCSVKATPSAGCVKYEFSRMKHRSAYPIQITPSLLTENSHRVGMRYQSAIVKFADLVLEYLNSQSQILVYACGQIDYFTIFAMQEVFRLLGVRNLTGNAEHCLNAGAVHNEILTGQEGPFVTIEHAVNGANRFYIFNGWNGSITHPPIFNQLVSKPDLNAVLFDVMHTETGMALEERIGNSCLGYLKPASDPQVALAVAHQIFTRFPQSIDEHFVNSWSDIESFNAFKALALQPDYALEQVAIRCAAQPEFEQRLKNLIVYIAEQLINKNSVPVIIPSVGLSQTTGVVGHCLWASILAMLGKFGLNTNGGLLGGVLRLPGQINAESEVQGLSRKFFLGRIPMADAAEAAARMELPGDVYNAVLDDEPIAALDYSEQSDKRQLFIFFGTQFEANMPNRRKWLQKLTDSGNKMVVVDPLIDTWTLNHAELIIPSPPHPATTKLYQNGEWRLSLSVPQKKAASQTRTDTTIIYDLMEELVNRFSRDDNLVNSIPHLRPLLASGYLQNRFCRQITNASDDAGLKRVQGEVSRSQLFARIQKYLFGGRAPLYCAFENSAGKPIRWQDLLEQGSIVYGGVGTHRFTLNYDEQISPFADIYRQPRLFKFFIPTPVDLQPTYGIRLNSGRSSLSDNKRRSQFALKSFNSGKATPIDDIPYEHPLHISHQLASQYDLTTGDWARLQAKISGHAIVAPVVVSNRIFGETVYISFHRSKAQALRDFYINDITDNTARCNYSSQVKLKTPEIVISKIIPNQSLLKIPVNKDVNEDELSLWGDTLRNFTVIEIIREADSCTTFRLVPESLCKLEFYPGQYCTINFLLGGKRQVRAYSISSSPTNVACLDITVKRVEKGLVSNWMPDNIIPGDSLSLGKPGGEFYLDKHHASKKLLFIAAGSGITPLMSMVRWLRECNPKADVDFYISTRSLFDVLFADELIHIESLMPNFNLWIIPTSPEYLASSEVLQGRISPALLSKISPDFVQREVYMCGPEGFMHNARKILLDLGHSENHIHQESFGLGKNRPGQILAGNLNVTFLKDGSDQKIIQADGSSTLLELSEQHNQGINSVCRAGICGACLIKVEGQTEQPLTEQLSEDQIAEGYRLACVCFPSGDCRVEVL